MQYFLLFGTLSALYMPPEASSADVFFVYMSSLV